MALRTSADNAEDVAAGIREFRGHLPGHEAEITSLMADLFALSSALKRLDDMTNDRRYQQHLAVVHPDLELVRTSLKITLEDIVDFFGDLEERGSTREVYRRTWMELCEFFREERGPLGTRLAMYKTYLHDLEDYMKGKFPTASYMASLRNNLKGLLAKQSSRVPHQLGSMSLSTPSSPSSRSAETGSPVSDRRPRTRKSYERPRPSHPSPHSPLSPTPGNSSYIPPSAPDAPGSPFTGSATSHSLGSNIVSDHWAKKVFTEVRSATRIPYVGESSKCFGDLTPGVKRWLHEQGFDELFQLGFHGDSNLRVYLYVREDDHRARIMCKALRSSQSCDYHCLPLNMLEIVRVGSCLQLCRRRHGGFELALWANLKFSTIEQMVLFFCTFLALRSQDCGRPVDHIRDYELDDEEELFGGPIVDDRFLHALRIYRDRTSGAIRLQASVHKGEMKRAPVWTAFITNHIGTRGWIRQADSKVVLLRELHRTVFAFQTYDPPRTARGEHILKFANRSDAQGFIETVAELARC
ncbi:hypothetical protein BDV28DRAFT_14638 [Aspergillus coremiiformis]|uniref:Uncharacterized protein n=1 Tax=Aspergillus coremiiformis TaxID=138285 RepID=A0A5N6Z249_9EURO|nr:hypothetical protein BDV28DRAFT_14638 [Aspergillus coremiiformis]